MSKSGTVDITAARASLEPHGQGHLLAFWDQLDESQKRSLLADIGSLEMDEVDLWVEGYVKNAGQAGICGDIRPAEFYAPEPSDSEQQRKYSQARQLGEKLIAHGKVAAFVVAGGQGTRLGFDGPKGDFPVSPIQRKTLFQIFAETVLAANQKYQTNCPWYVMTSPLNHAQTIEVFEKNGYFGLEERDVVIFQQGTMPNFSFEGKVLLAAKDKIARSPDGHGGSLKALKTAGALQDMKKRGIEIISYWQVDNPLVNIFDPLFVGLHAMDGAEMSSKALRKSGPYEKVGNFCLLDGRLTVIEYSDLPNELAEQQNPDGSLVFELGSIAIHMINVSFVERLNEHGFALPLHRAVKKIACIDDNGKQIRPSEPNGVKLETFIFDALPLASKSIILETVRSEEFAPVKNATGTDSAEATHRMMIERAAAWLESAGLSVPRKDDGSPDCVIEMAPGFALHRPDVRGKLDQVPEIAPGSKVYLS